MGFSRMSNSLRLIPDKRFGWPAQVGVLSVPVAENPADSERTSRPFLWFQVIYVSV